MFKNYKKAFTLAEVMIVLTVIGIITAIIMPIAFHATPDENVMKFKKANSTLYQAIQELVNSDKYYKDGDLGMKPDGTLIFNDGGSGTKYLCNTFADVVSTKSVNCSTATVSSVTSYLLINGKTVGTSYSATDVTEALLTNAKQTFDTYCKTAAKTRKKEIELTDGTVFYRTGNAGFGSNETTTDDGTINILRYFSPPSQFPANYGDTSGFDVAYMIFCLDVDGFDETKGSDACDDSKDTCPFGYGIRADGKILPGARADEWLKKDIQDN